MLKYACLQKISHIWPCLTLFGPVLTHLAPFFPVWHHLAQFCPTCLRLALLGQFSISILKDFKVPIRQGVIQIEFWGTIEPDIEFSDTNELSPALCQLVPTFDVKLYI